MDNMTLVALLDSDREMILGNLRADRSPQAAQAALEKAIDRVALRYAEQNPEEDAQRLLKTLKSALPLVDAVGEVRRWEKTVDLTAGKPKWTPMALGLLAAGAVLELAVMLGLLFTGGRLTGMLAFLEAIIPGALGIAAIFWAGKLYAKPAPVKSEAPAVREEFLIDPEKVFHHLRGMLLMADSVIEGARRVEKKREQAATVDTAGTKLDPRQAELMANLLETAYAHDDADSRETVQSIAFYLHSLGVEVVNCVPDNEAWFEFLPAPAPGTLRPALVSGDKVVKKGLAAK